MNNAKFTLNLTVIVCTTVLLLASCAAVPKPAPDAAALSAAWNALLEDRFAEAEEAFASLAGAEAARGRALALFARGLLPEAGKAFLESISLDPDAPESAVIRSWLPTILPVGETLDKALAKADDTLAASPMPWSARAGLRGQLEAATDAGLDAVKARAAAAKLGAVTAWRLLGPVVDPSGAGMDRALIDEGSLRHPDADEKAITTVHGDAIWIDVPDVGPSGLLRPSDYLGSPEEAFYYASALVTIKAGDAGPRYAIVDQDCAAYKLTIDGWWISGSSRQSEGSDRSWQRVDLAEGDHRVLLKIRSGRSPASFRLFLVKDGDDPAATQAAEAYVASLPGIGGPDASPLLGRLAARFSSYKSLESAFWLALGLADSGYGETAASVASGEFADYAAKGSALASYALYYGNYHAGDWPKARAALMAVDPEKGFAAREELVLYEALDRRDYRAIMELAPVGDGPGDSRFHTLYYRAIASLALKEGGFEAYAAFSKAFPEAAELAYAVLRRGGMNQPIDLLIKEASRSSYAGKGGALALGVMMDYGAYGPAFALAQKLLALSPADPEIVLSCLQAGFFARSYGDGDYVQRLMKAIKAQPGIADFHYALANILSDRVDELERASMKGGSEEAARLAKEKESLITALKVVLADDPALFVVRERILTLGGKPSPDLAYGRFDPEEAIRAYEASGASPGGDVAFVSRRDHKLFFEDGGTRRYSFIILKILSRAGLETQSSQDLEGELNGERFTIRRAYALSPDGRRKEALRDGAHLSYPGLELGDYLVLDYLADGARTGSLRYEFWTDCELQSYAYTADREIAIAYPSSSEALHALHGSEGLEIGMAESAGSMDGYSELRVTAKALPAARRQMPSAGRRDELAWLDVSSIKDWTAVAEWCDYIMKGCAVPSPAVTAKARSLLEGVSDRREAIARLYRFASSEIAYEDLAFQYSAFTPQPAQEVMEEGVGDCKDKSTLLIALLSAAGIEARYALSEPSYRGERAYLPSNRFSHVLVQVKEGGTWIALDPTSSVFSYPDLPAILVGTRILPIMGGRGVQTGLEVLRPAIQAGSVWVTSLELAEGDGTVEARAFLRGEDAAELRSMMATANPALRQSLAEAFADDAMPGAELTRYAFQDEKGIVADPSISFAARFPHGIRRSGGRPSLVLPWAKQLPEGLLFAARKAERTSALTLEGTWLATPYRQTYIVTLPPGYSVERLPEAAAFSFMEARASFGFGLTQGKLVVQRELFFPQMNVAPEDLAAFKAFVEAVWAKQNEAIALASDK